MTWISIKCYVCIDLPVDQSTLPYKSSESLFIQELLLLQTKVFSNQPFLILPRTKSKLDEVK